MTTILTTILFLTAFQKIEGVNFKGNIIWAFILAFVSLAATSLFWILEFLKLMYVPLICIGIHRYFHLNDNKALILVALIYLGIKLSFVYKDIQKVGLATYISNLATTPLRFVAKHFPDQLSFDNDKAVEKLTMYIHLLTFLCPFTLG